MFWLRRPPYLRWIAAGALLLTGLVIDLRGPAVEAYPFATEPINAGDLVEGRVQWRDVPVGLLPAWEQPVSGVAGEEIPVGYPLIPSSIARVIVPEGWWAISVPLPVVVAPGTQLRVSDTTTGSVANGIVVGPGNDDGFEITGMVAFPAEDSANVAAAVANDALVVMIGNESGRFLPGG